MAEETVLGTPGRGHIGWPCLSLSLQKVVESNRQEIRTVSRRMWRFWRFQIPKEAVSSRRLTGDIYLCAHTHSFQAAVRTLVINMHTQPVVQTLVIASR